MNKSLLTAVVTVVGLVAPAFAVTRNVPGDYATIEAALAAAQPGDTVLVAAGDYSLASYDGITVPSGVTLKGAGATPEATVVSAHKASDKDTASAALVSVTGGTLENLTFTGARCTTTDNVPCALAAYDGALVTNCVFTGTKVNAGGNVVLIDGSATRFVRSTLANTTLSGGKDWTYGGDAIVVQNFAEIHDSFITNNVFRPARGKGILVLASGGKVYDSVFANNTASSIEVQSGRAPLCIASDGADCVIDGCTITGNFLGRDSGAGANFEGAGGLAVLSAATIRNTKITNNSSADSLGGGVYCKAAAVFENVLVAGNKTFTTSPKSPKNGCGGMYVNGAATLKHVTVTDNDVELTLGGIKTYGAWLNGATATNCIFWGNRPDVSATSGNVVVSGAKGFAAYSLAASVDEFTNASNAASGTECLGGDPLFTDAANGDYTLTSVSPAMDAGSDAAGVATDIRGVARPKNAGYEMGCYECEYAAEYICSFAPLKKTLGPSGGDVTFTASMTMPKQVKTVTWTVTSETGTPPAAKTGNPCTFTFPAGQNMYEVSLEVEWTGGQEASAPETAIVKVVKMITVAPGEDLYGTLADLTGLSADDPVTVNLSTGTYTAENSGVVAGADWMYVLNPGVILKGAGVGQTILDAGGTNRVLKLAAGSAVSDLTVTNAASRGYAVASRGYGAEVNGGTLSSCVFASGKAWAGSGDASEDCVYVTAGLIADCEVYGCTYVSSSASRGGIVRLDAGTIRGTKIHHNDFQAQTGNALTLVGPTTLAEDCDIYNNTSGNREYRPCGSGGVGMWGGATMRNCCIYNNVNTAGAGRFFAGGLCIGGYSLAVGTAGGMAENCIITNNTSGGYDSSHILGCAGGVVLADNGRLRNCLVANNRLTGGTTLVAGGVLVMSDSSAVENCTVTDNSLSTCTDKSGVSAWSSGLIRNTVIWNNALDTNELTVVTSCCLEDPKFKPGRYTVSSDSPCRNAGANDESWMPDATDLAGAARILENIVDIGCYEYDPAAACECSFTIDRTTVADDRSVVCTAAAEPLDNLYAYVWTFDCAGLKTVVTNTDSKVQSQNLPVTGVYTVSLRVLWGTDAQHITVALDAAEHPTLTVLPRTVSVTPGGALTIAQAFASVYKDADDPGIVMLGAGTYTAENSGVEAEADWMYVLDGAAILKGVGRDQTILDGGSTNRILKLSNGAAACDLTVANAQSGGLKGTTLYGYGVDANNASLSNCLVACGLSDATTGNAAEHFIYLNGGVISDCEVTGVTYSVVGSARHGGVVYVADGTVRRTKIHGNSFHDNGGALALVGANVLAEDCDVYGNTESGVEYRDFGAAGVGVVQGATLRKSRIYNNVCMGGSGRFYAGGVCAADFAQNTTGGTVENCVITNNACTYKSNFAEAIAGGAIVGKGGTMRNCLIADNRLTGVNDSKGSIGGGVVMIAASAKVESCTVVGNVLNGSRIDNAGVSAQAGEVLNTISWNNGGTPTGGEWTDANFTNVEATVTYTCTTPLQAGVGNVAQDPKFRRGYLLKSSSPCRDTGSNQDWMTGAVDLYGNPRIQCGVVDMGCVEMPRASGLMMLVR